MMLLDDIFEMGSGYVLDFSDKTMALFFAEDLNIDIENDAYRKYGTSKAKRLRCFLQTVDPATAVRVLNALWEYREALRHRKGTDETVHNAQGRLLELINRLQGGAPAPSSSPVVAFDRAKLEKLKGELTALAQLAPHRRGYDFEKFLKDLFDAYGLEARNAFRVTGEQIDGSFILGSDTYLLEAKWQNEQVGSAELFTFQGKISEKMAWTRGLFVSYSGFSDAGLRSFGRGKSVICMDGLDLHESLNRQLPFDKVLQAKVRRGSETGDPFIRVRDLFPN